MPKPGADAAEQDVAAKVAEVLGKAFTPERIVFVGSLPKTRSAKIVRRAVRAKVLGKDPATSRRSRTPSRSRRSRMPSELTGVALVTGGGRGIGADVARELARAGMRVAVSARTRAQVEAVAQEIGGLAIEADVSKQADVERMVEQTERELGPIDLLVANAGIALWEERAWEVPVRRTGGACRR